ncbi:MAG: hypothetical protein J3Q66DRAFT_407870 [Benniella sp.]|nr:MAG: hypothetical protein J3Q66DRAFT_407870 [Benniella sp.]
MPRDCSEIGNFGVRAIVRSCVGHERLGLSRDYRVSLRIFRGPWVYLDLVELDILEVNVGFRGLGGMMDMNGENDDDDYWRNEDEWELDGIDEDINDDYGIDDNSNNDDDSDATEIYGYDGKPMNLKYPPLGRRNQTSHRTTLQEFYKRLGQLKHLRKLNMSNADYRIRIHDGLLLVLPGLRNSLEEWNITRYPEYRLHHDELAWIGRHSGYWFKYPNSEGGPEYQRRMIQKFNADGNPDRYRIGKLQSLTVSVHAPGYLTTDVDEWFEDQGIALCYQDEDESDTDSDLLEPEDIYSACRVSCLFHSVCVQELWKVIHLDGCKAAAIWHGHEGFHMGLVRYGFFVEELRLARTYIGTEDMRIIAMNCTRLRVLDLTGTRVQAEALKVLLHSDPYANLPGSSEKRQQRTHTGGKVGKGVGRDRMDVHVEVDMEGKMWKYRRMVAAANGGYSGPYPSAAGPVSPFHVKPSSVSLTTESTTPGFRSATTSSTFTSNMLLLHQPITRLPLTHLSVVGTDVSDEGPVSLIRASRGTLSSIAAHATEFAYEFLFAFVEDRPTTEIQVGLPELHLEMSELELEQQTDCGPAKRTFTPNTVLTSIDFTGLSEVFDGGFDELSRYAIELSTVCLEGCGLGDEPLSVLAENYRKRMEIKGLACPKLGTTTTLETRDSKDHRKKGRRKGNPPVIPPSKFYTSGKVMGGLKVLWLKDCPEIGNKGVRAIVRSYVGLERMNVGYKESIGLMDGDISEEICETVRFPIKPAKGFNTRLDFDRGGTYDFISRSSYEFEDDSVWEEDFGEEELEEEDSGEEVFSDDAECLFDSDDEDDLSDIDLEFYKRLGQLKHLRKLNVSNSDYRIRIHDGLHLVLPGLRNSLEEWNITRYPEYRLHHDEWAWIGRHFGYGFKHPNSEGGPEY